MSTRAIRTSTSQTICDVCGRTLLRGERSHVYLAGSDRHSVCELCTSRALHGGWVREGSEPDYDAAGSGLDRRRGRLGLRRGRRRPEPVEEFTPPPDFLSELAPEPDAVEDADTVSDDVEATPELPAPPPRRSRRRRTTSLRGRAEAPARSGAGGREPRHVHAVPTSVEHRIVAAVELFNDSEHPRTVAGIARSLGLPDVSVYPTSPVGAIVDLVVSWELCWYRYEVDLSEETPTVRGSGQGYEASDLTELERTPNAVADDSGRLAVATGNLQGR